MRAIALFMATTAAAGAPEQIQVAVDPASSTPASTLELAAPLNAIVSGRLVLLNSGAEGSVLHWEAATTATTCAKPQPARWLEIEPTSGSLEGGHSTGIAVYASSFAASTGVRRGFLCIRSGIVAEPLVEVPVALTVEGSIVADP